MDRFSQRYLAPSKLSADSHRLRVRLDALLGSLVGLKIREVATEFRIRQGVHVSDNNHPFTHFEEMRDVLDGISTVTEYLKNYEELREGLIDYSDAARWVSQAAVIFREEHVAYRIDDGGLAHFAVDESFEYERLATLAGLGVARYSAARQEFDDAFKRLRSVSPNGKSAIRGVFAAVETVFKLMFTKTPRLGSAEIKTHLKPIIARAYAADVTSLRSMEKEVESFMGWVEAAHFYRHAQGEEEPTEPPLETTVLLLSQGSAFLRWLVTVDAAEQARASA